MYSEHTLEIHPTAGTCLGIVHTLVNWKLCNKLY